MREDLGINASEIHPHTSLVQVGTWTTIEEAYELLRTAEDPWTGGHYLDVPTTILIDE